MWPSRDRGGLGFGAVHRSVHQPAYHTLRIHRHLCRICQAELR